jgi:hypothetical protein
VTTEKQFQEQVIDIARSCHWLIHHDRGDYRQCIGGDAGFPDLVMARKGRVIFAELKSKGGKVSSHQLAWLGMLGEGSVTRRGSQPEVYLWRPAHLDQIADILSPRHA